MSRVRLQSQSLAMPTDINTWIQPSVEGGLVNISYPHFEMAECWMPAVLLLQIVIIKRNLFLYFKNVFEKILN
jgi:hypothetical protein